MSGRTDVRQTWATETRIAQAEVDLDLHDRELSAFDERLGKMLWTLVGILISTTTAAVLLALNLLVVGR